MDHLQQFLSQIRRHLFGILILNNLLLAGVWWYASSVFAMDDALILITIVGAGIAIPLALAWLSSAYISQPMRLIWQAILHISPHTANMPAPNLKHSRLGHELVVTLINNIYQLANVVGDVERLASIQKHDLSAEFVANALPLPLVVLDKEGTIQYANDAMLDSIKRTNSDLQGQNVYTVLDMSFTNEHTLDRWLERVRSDKITAARTWERVKVSIPDEKEPYLCDLVAYYNKNNPDGYEIMLVFFDRTRQYSQDEQALSFVALAVHELRTPLTLLRGYAEALEEDLEGKISPELDDYIHKLKAAAEQLSTFTSNILNVARFENDQLVLKLREENWAPLLRSAVNGMGLRAQVQGITLTLKVDDKLPTVGVDAVSMYEVISNLIDNAIKYSGDSKEIIIRSYLTTDGVVETTVQDFGVGVVESAIPNLFDKFYRNHRNRAAVGGTGMGLFLAKAIVNAHGGHIWVRSKEGEGSTFGFTVQPYAALADELKSGDNKQRNIMRTAHGWIKNHSMYRR